VRSVPMPNPTVDDGRQRLNKGESKQINAFLAHFARMTTCTNNIGNVGSLQQGGSHHRRII
jgi:hypothetical protein